jgi:hypothetical protein
MGIDNPPIAVRIVGWIYILTGVVGFAIHFSELKAPNTFPNEAFWVELVSLIAIVSGAYLLRGHNWARWLALGWIGFHVVLSFFHTRFELAMHVACPSRSLTILARQPELQIVSGVFQHPEMKRAAKIMRCRSMILYATARCSML